MGAIDQFLIWGIDPRGEDVISQNPFATNDHEAFHHYSRQLTLADTNALNLPASIEGPFFVKDGGDSGVIGVYADGTVNLLATSSGVSVPGGGGDIQIGDITSDDSTQIRNNSGSDSNLTVIGFYR